MTCRFAIGLHKTKIWLTFCALDRGPAVRPNWNRLFEIAAAQEGLFTTKQAAEARYSPQLLTHYVHAGRAIRVGRSIYRLVHFPAGEHEELVAAGACRCQSGPRAIWRARRVTRTYSTPAAFKPALEQRLRTSATSGPGFARKRHRWLHVSSGLHDVEPRDLLEVARVRGKQRAPTLESLAASFEEVRDIVPPRPEPREVYLTEAELLQALEGVPQISLKELGLENLAPAAETGSQAVVIGGDLYFPPEGAIEQ